jgi:hypothetical protein
MPPTAETYAGLEGPLNGFLSSDPMAEPPPYERDHADTPPGSAAL